VARAAPLGSPNLQQRILDPGLRDEAPWRAWGEERVSRYRAFRLRFSPESARGYDDSMRAPAIVLLLVSIPFLPAFAAEEIHVVSTNENKERVLLLLEGELLGIGKWPLEVQLFDTGELSECFLEHSKIIDLKKIRIKKNDNPELPFLLLCGDQMVSARRATAVTVAPAEEIAPETQPWRVEREEATMTVHWRESGTRQWTITFRRP
jgi:hypothetical protein